MKAAESPQDKFLHSMKRWLYTFWRILIHPLPTTFIEEAKKAQNKLTVVVVWIEIGIALVYFLEFLATRYIPSLRTVLSAVIFLPIIFLFYVFSVNLVYMRVFHRRRNIYNELLYLMTSILLITIVFSSMFSFLPRTPIIFDYISFLPFLYGFILIIITVHAVGKMKFWQATVTVFLSTVLAVAGFLCIPAFIGSLMNTVPQVF